MCRHAQTYDKIFITYRLLIIECDYTCHIDISSHHNFLTNQITNPKHWDSVDGHCSSTRIHPDLQRLGS